MEDYNGMGNGGMWLFIIVLFALFRGFGGNGSVSENYTITSDMAQLNNRINQIGDALGNGIADATFSLNNTIVNGNFETRNAINNLSSQLAQCCCATQRAIDGVNYNMSINTRDIMNNDNNNYQRIMDRLCHLEMEYKDHLILQQQSEINSLRLTASQNAQSEYLISQLKA